MAIKICCSEGPTGGGLRDFNLGSALHKPELVLAASGYFIQACKEGWTNGQMIGELQVKMRGSSDERLMERAWFWLIPAFLLNT